LWVRVLGTAAALAVILSLVSWRALLQAMARVPPGLWLAVVAGLAFGHAIAALKWRKLVCAATGSARGVDVRAALRAHAAGLFANLCLPSIVGGDVVRAALLRGHARLGAIAAAGIADRGIDTFVLVALSCAGATALALGEATTTTPASTLLRTGGAAAIAGAALLGAGAAAAVLVALQRLPAGRLPPRARSALATLREAAAALAARPGAALTAFALSFAVQTGFIALNFALGLALGIEQSFGVWLLCWPLAKLVALVPVSLGGLGVRDATLAGLLTTFGTPFGLGAAQALSWQAALIALGAACGLLAFASPFGRGHEQAP